MADRPVELIPGDDADKEPEDGMGLCLSGGGYRAMVFHLGALWRLYEARLLKGAKRISTSPAARSPPACWPSSGRD